MIMVDDDIREAANKVLGQIVKECKEDQNVTYIGPIKQCVMERADALFYIEDIDKEIGTQMFRRPVEDVLVEILGTARELRARDV